MRAPVELLGNHRLTQLLHDADALGLARGGIGSTTGTPLPAELAGRLAAVVGADLSKVRVHRGERAAAAAAGLGARAYTLGTDVVLGARAPDPASAEGRELLAHEAAHVVQQQRGLAPAGSVESPSGAAERAARETARKATATAPTADTGSAPAGGVRMPAAVTSTAAPVVQRDTDEETPPPGHGSHLSPTDLVNEAFWHHPVRPDKFAAEVAERAFWLTWQGPAHYSYVEAVLERMSSYNLDDSVARDVVLGGRPEDLDGLAATPGGRRLLDSLSRHLISGNLSANDEQAAHLIEVARARQIPVEDYISRAGRAPIFPVRQMGVTRSDDAPLSARRLPDGRIWVKLPSRVRGMDMFAEESATLPLNAFLHDGLVLEPDELVGIRDYDAGGEVEFLPATALLVMGSKSYTSTWHSIGSAAATGASLGVGGAGVAAESTLGRALLVADRAAAAIGALGTVIGEHRDWAIRTFGADFVRLVDVANSVVAVYGMARLASSTAGAGAELVQSIRRRWQNVRASGRLAQLRAADATTARLVGELDRAVEQLPKPPPSAGERLVQHLDEWAEEPKGGLSSLGAKEADDLLKAGWKRLRKGKSSGSPKPPKPAPHAPASKTAAKKSGGKRGSAKSDLAKGGGSKGGGTKGGGAKAGGAKKPAAKAPVVTLKADVLPHYPSKAAFMADMRKRLLAQRQSGKPSLLDFLLAPDGEWRKGTFVARSGRTMRGRYALSDPDQTIVHAGHMQSDWYAKVMGRRDYLMLEDADLNWMSGSAETAGAVTNKPAVLLDNYAVDIPTAQMWEARGALPPGTVSAAPVVEPPAL
ncbi:polymorphic toxin type 5 domain-containing protein [Streptomyces sp. NBC_00140]|uniref:polymorphic toxin type 5 domain-containing protein n=1 Tax=Streptomyces sp. NBC_00140 TaxID=2975664 RepID=UPI00224D7693|nr:polymorphic toxin type 5 domain-containing protein [Streptomyces sp. NBC_00140]MCX5328335.1 polymorphic toxin type 5 domain-containing protein [Streptomyces sp. NBC_00140]